MESSVVVRSCSVRFITREVVDNVIFHVCFLSPPGSVQVSSDQAESPPAPAEIDIVEGTGLTNWPGAKLVNTFIRY